MRPIEKFITRRMAQVLLNVENGQKRSMSKIARTIKCQFTLVSNYMDLFEQKGFVIKQKNGREVKVSLTPKGKELCKHLEGVWGVWYEM